jgi:hypothetical protein
LYANLDMPGSITFTSTPTDCYWFITPLAATDSVPSVISRDQDSNLEGTTLLGAVPIRMYRATPRDFAFSSVNPSITISSGQIPYEDGSNFNITNGIKQPYRIYRRDLRRVTSSEIVANKEDALFYFDTSVVSLSPSNLANLPKDSYLTVDDGTYFSIGYRSLVADSSYSYSTKEEGFIDLPLKVLPIGSDDSPDSFISLVGAPLQINYEKSELIGLIQSFLDSSDDRVASANMLARHLLPAYTSYFASYSNGADPSVIAADIFKYIETLPVDQTLDVSELELLITRYNGNPNSPTSATTTIHDWDRRMWAEFSNNQLANLNSVVPYAGSSRVTHFVPGKFVSADTETPENGERITLTRQ